MNHIGGSYCFTITDMMKNFGKSKHNKFSYTAEKRNDFIRKVLQTFMQLVLEDVVKNGVQFRFSTPSEAYIQVEGVFGEEFKRQRRLGRFYEIDPFKSNFTGHEVLLSWKSSRRLHKRSIVVNYDLKQIIIDKTNAGLKY